MYRSTSAGDIVPPRRGFPFRTLWSSWTVVRSGGRWGGFFLAQYWPIQGMLFAAGVVLRSGSFFVSLRRLIEL